MKNCLVTKLKGTVSNGNLLKFGEGRLKVRTSGGNQYITFYTNGETTTFKILSNSPDDVFITSSQDPTEVGKEVTIASSTCTLFFKQLSAAREIELSFNSKYNITGINAVNRLGATSLEDLAEALYCATDFRLDNNNEYLTGNLSALSGKGITYLGIGNTGVVGTTDDVASMVNMETLGFPRGVSGSLENLKGMTGLTLLFLNNSTVGDGESINSLFNYWASLGKEGELNFNRNQVVIAENDAQGNPPANGKVVFTNNSWHWNIVA